MSYWAFPNDKVDEVERALIDQGGYPAPQWFSRGPIKPRGPWMMGFRVDNKEQDVWMTLRFELENKIA
jgi:hypothetical protein